MARCACAAWDMGSSRSMTAATCPAPMSGHTWSRTAATLPPDDDEPAVGGQRGQVAGQVAGAHDVQDHVGARAAGGFEHGRDEILLAVVDGDVGAELAAAGQLLRRARGAGDPGPE